MREIFWEPWRDPLRGFVDKDDDSDEEEGIVHTRRRQLYSGPCLVGPMGVLPLTEDNSPSANFNLWVGHANFDIGPEEMEAIETAPGVELLRVWSRYRIWVGVGLNFESGPVLEEIERRLCHEVLPNEDFGEEPAPVAMFAILDEAHPYWAVANLPEGKIDIFGADSRGVVETRVENWRKGGLNVLTSWGGDGDV